MSAKPETTNDGRLRDAMHRWVDQVMDAKPIIDRIAVEMGAGYPGQSLGGARGGGEDDGSTAAMAVSAVDDPRWDPGAAASRWNTARLVAFTQLGTLARDAARLKPMSRWLAERRTNDEMHLCARCKLPAPSGRDEAGNPTLRFDKDGEPFHGTPCFDLGIGCAVCGNDTDRLRREMCAACYAAWLRSDRPSLAEMRVSRAHGV